MFKLNKNILQYTEYSEEYKYLGVIFQEKITPQRCRYWVSFESWWAGTGRDDLKNLFLQLNMDLNL